jgi:hypothetical protein
MVRKPAAAPKRPRGRPPKPDAERKRGIFAMRMRDGTMALLAQRAAANQRSLSEEGEALLEYALHAEERLDQSFDLTFGRPAAGLLMVLARAIRDTGPHAGFMTTMSQSGAENWLNNPYAFNEVSSAVTDIIDGFRPEGTIEPPRMPDGPPGSPDLNKVIATIGREAAKHLLEAIANPAGGSDRGLEQWAAPARERLGPAVIERIKKNITLSEERRDG